MSARRAFGPPLSILLLAAVVGCQDGLVPTVPGDMVATTDRQAYGPSDTVYLSLRNDGGATVGVLPYVFARRHGAEGWAETASMMTGPGGSGVGMWVRVPLKAGAVRVDTVPVSWFLSSQADEFRFEHLVLFSDGQERAVVSSMILVQRGS